MKKKNNTAVCPECGAELPKKKSVCESCGHHPSKKKEKEIVYATARELGQAVLADTAKRRRKRGRRANKPKRSLKGRKGAILARFMALLLSLAFLALAFMPAVNLGFEIEEDKHTTVGIGAKDAIIFAVDYAASLFLSEKQVKKSDLYNDFVNALNDFHENMGTSVSAKENRKFGELWILAVRVELRLGARLPIADIVCAALASLIYLIFCIFMFLRSFFGLIRALRGKPKPLVKHTRGFIRMFAFLPIFYFTMSAFARFGANGVITKLFVPNTVSISLYFLLTVVISAVYLLRLTRSAVRRRRGKSNKKRFFRTFLVCACSILLIVAVFLPFLSMDITAKSDGKRIRGTLVTSSYCFSMMEGREGRYYEKIDPDMLEEIIVDGVIYIRDEDLTSAELDQVSESIMNYAVMTDNVDKFMVLSPITYGVAILLLLSASRISVRSFSGIILPERRRRGKLFFSRFATLITAVAYFAMSAVIAIIANEMMYDADISDLFYVRIGLGAIITLAASLAIALIPLKKQPREKAREYDDPDVSYSPYII